MIKALSFVLVTAVKYRLMTYQTDSSREAFNSFLCGQACGGLPDCGGFYWNQQLVSLKERKNYQKHKQTDYLLN